jgi:hypothetical protein
MTEKQFYEIIYRRLGKLTPIPVDCGQLCGGACCEGDRNGDGMYLFPGEEKMYGDISSWAMISQTDFEYENGVFAPLFACDGVCNRNERPLSCRIFPLTPYVDKSGKLTLIIDPRGRTLCPMTALHLSDFDGKFVKAVYAVSKILMKNPHCRAFITSFSRMIDENLY